MLKLANLPDTITGGKTVLQYRIGLTEGLSPLKSQVIRQIKSRGGKYRVVSVLSAALRNSRDLHGQPYKPSVWVFSSIPYNPE